MKVTVVGAGYIGLVTAIGLAELKNRVTLAVRRPYTLEQLEAGNVPFYEAGLRQAMERVCTGGYLQFAPWSPSVGDDSDVVMLTVGTPSGEDGSCDIGNLMRVALELAGEMRPGAVLVVKSTVPVGTCRTIADTAGGKVAVVSNPEFLRESSALSDFSAMKRIIVGCRGDAGLRVMEELYEEHHAGVVRMSLESAEFAKLASNTLLATRVALGNELADAAEVLGADFRTIAPVLACNPAIGPYGLIPGPGIGGSCFPKDVRTLAYQAAWKGAPIQAAGAFINGDQNHRNFCIEKVLRVLQPDPKRRDSPNALGGTVVAVLGLAYKAGTDDIRNSPAIALVEALYRRAARVRVHDPEAMQNAREKLSGGVEMSIGAFDAMRGADAVVIMTDWPVYALLDLKQVKSAMSGSTVFDFRNILHSGEAWRTFGERYYGVGFK